MGHENEKVHIPFSITKDYVCNIVKNTNLEKRQQVF